MNEKEINDHWEYTEIIIKHMLDLAETLYKLGMKHGAKHEEAKSG